jgi:hypothetical protein
MMAKAKDDLLGVCILSARHVANLHPRIILTPYKLLGKSRDYISKTGDRQDDHLRTMNMQVIVLSVTCFYLFVVTCFSLNRRDLVLRALYHSEHLRLPRLL